MFHYVNKEAQEVHDFVSMVNTNYTNVASSVFLQMVKNKTASQYQQLYLI